MNLLAAISPKFDMLSVCLWHFCLNSMDGMLCDSTLMLIKYKCKHLTENRWHFFTAIGGYVAVATVDLITSGEVHQDPTDSLAWPAPLMAKLVEPKLDFMKHK